LRFLSLDAHLSLSTSQKHTHGSALLHLGEQGVLRQLALEKHKRAHTQPGVLTLTHTQAHAPTRARTHAHARTHARISARRAAGGLSRITARSHVRTRAITPKHPLTHSPTHAHIKRHTHPLLHLGAQGGDGRLALQLHQRHPILHLGKGSARACALHS
jgi:hypothetical protein